MVLALLFGIVLAMNRIEIRDPQQRLVLNTAELQRLCASGDHIFACTFFPTERLECHCHEHQSQWYELFTATLEPVMILSRPANASHEWLHLHDLRNRLETYLIEAEGQGYASAHDCEAAARARTASFHQVMSGFRRESNERYH